MERAEGEGGHLQRDQGVADGARAVFLHELRAHTAFDEDVEFRATWMRVGGVEATRAKESDRHRRISANERRKGHAVGANCGAAQASRSARVGGRVKEIEDEVTVLRDHGDAVDGFGSEEERLHDGEVVGKAIDRGPGGVHGGRSGLFLEGRVLGCSCDKSGGEDKEER